MNGYSLFFVVIFCGCAVWSLAGLIFPKVLVVAPPERRTRGYAFFFPLAAAVFFFGLALFCDPKVQAAGVSLILFGGIPGMLLWRKMHQPLRPCELLAAAKTDRELQGRPATPLWKRTALSARVGRKKKATALLKIMNATGKLWTRRWIRRRAARLPWTDWMPWWKRPLLQIMSC